MHKIQVVEDVKNLGQCEDDWCEVARQRLAHEADGVSMRCAGQKSLGLSVHVDVIQRLPDLTQGWILELEILLEFPQPVFYLGRMDCQSRSGSPARQGPATEIAFVFTDRRIGLLDRGFSLILGQFFL